VYTLPRIDEGESNGDCTQDRRRISGERACFQRLGTPRPRGQPEDKKTVAVDEIFGDLAKAGSPGCALGVYRDGKMIYSKDMPCNLEENVPVTPQSVFDIGSTSKQFTAASILLLEKQGKLSLNDDVRKYIPELPDYGQKITMLQSPEPHQRFARLSYADGSGRHQHG